MSKHGISRIVAVLVGATTLFVLQQKLGVQLYIAATAGVLVYFGTRLAMDRALGVDPRAK
jgi:small basic protein